MRFFCMDVFTKLPCIANSGVLAPVPAGGKYLVRDLPGPLAIKVGIEYALKVSAGGSVSAPNVQQAQAVAERLVQAAKAAVTADCHRAPFATEPLDFVLEY
eukprot:jgi/Chrzof1/5285/Cz15g20210.t1